MATKPPCTQSELVARVVAIEVAHVALKDFLVERDRRYEDRALSQDRAVSIAMDGSKSATSKAEMATEKRLEGLNELRAMAEDQARNYARLDEMKIIHSSMDKRIDELALIQRQQMAHGGGMKEAFGYIVGFAGILIAGAALYLKH